MANNLTINAIKPPEKGNYRSVEQALAELETVHIPDTEDNSGKSNLNEVKPDNSGSNNSLQEDIPFVDLDGRLIDLNPANNCSEEIQDEWVDYFNDRNKIMISMPDLYLAGKSNNQALLTSLKKDCDESSIITSTRIIFNKNDLYGQIIHYFGSTVTKPIDLGTIYIPHYDDNSLTYVLNKNDGLVYLQTLFNTKDDAEQIKQNLLELSIPKLDFIRIWTPDQVTRMNYPRIVSGIGYRDHRFRISYCSRNFSGRSRGVIGGSP